MANVLQMMPLEFTDFSGGITDYYLDCPDNQYANADNLVITDNRKVATRSGSVLVDQANYLPGYVLANTRTGYLFSFEGQIFEVQGSNCYYNSAGYHTLLGPGGNPAVPNGAGNYANSAYWNHHQIVVSDGFGPPQKIYKDNGGVFRVRNAGLPKLATAPTLTGSILAVCAMANNLKVVYNAHLADFGAGAHSHTSADATNSITAANAVDLATLITLVTQMLTKFTAHEADSQLASAWLYHKAKATVSRALASQVAPVTLADCILRLIDLKAKLNSHDGDATAHNTGGLHQDADADPASHAYLYTFCFTYQYQVGAYTFKDYGPTTQVSLAGVDFPNINQIAITNIPTLANGAMDNWDTANIQIEIYRTTDGGQTSYYLGTVANGVNTFNDTISDTNLQNNLPIYTDGGVKDNDQPPRSKYVVVAGDICWYLNVQELVGGAWVPKANRVRQSVKYDIDSCPASFYTDLEDDIVGGSSVGTTPIIFCNNWIYRLEGYIDSTGRGAIQKVELSRTVGCVSQNSIVKTQYGLFWAGQDGFYWTDGYQIQKISKDINTSYLSLIATAVQKKNIYGTFDYTNTRIIWAVQRFQTSPDNDSFYYADLKFKNGATTPFTTASGSTSFSPTAVLYYNGVLYRADRRGYLFQHLDAQQTDPKVDTALAPANWGKQTIIYSFKSKATNFGSSSVRKWVTKCVIYAKNVSNVSIGINSYNNDSPFASALKEVRMLANIVWGDANLNWGDPNIIWNFGTLIKAERNFPSRGLRCDYKQVEFTNSLTIIDNSDTLGLCNVDAVAKTATLVTNPPNIWTADCVDYSISFQTDNYTRSYPITIRTDGLLTFQDPGNNVVGGNNVGWVIKGYRKNDVLSLISFSLFFGYISDTQDKFSKSDTGANA